MMSKLVGVERTINIYDSNTEELIDEKTIEIALEILVRIVAPKLGDEHVYDGYVLTQKQLDIINSHIVDKV